MRPGAACLQCRNGKRKCDKPVLGTVCEQCKKRQLPCSSLNRRSSSTTILRPSLHDTRASSNTLPLPSVVDIEQLVELYIRFIHDKPHTLFHEPTLRSAVKNGTLPHTVLFGILGLSARFSDRPEIRSQRHAFSLEAKRLVKADLENVCIETVQACILAGNICLAESNPDSESLFFVIANRMALLLGFSSESSADDCVLRETKRRVWWSLYLIDGWASAGLGLPRQFHIGGSLVPRLPMDEVEFQNMISGGEEANIDWSPGIWAHMISLVQIFGHIQDLNQNLVESDWDEDHIESSVFSLAGQLISFESDLPSTMLCTQENLALQVKRGVGRTFVALHLGYHHYATLLYYQYLDPHRPATPNGRMYAQRCKYHATEFCELIRTSREYGHTEAFHNVVGHMTVVSSSVLLHTLLLGDDEELPMARQRLESNFESLVKLREFWPSVELMMNRLITFQNACLRTAMLGTHRFDKWMVKFLLQHALALDEKGSTSEEGFVDGVLLEDERLRERSRVTENIIRA